MTTKTKECLHYWEHGYTLEPVIFCTKCNKEVDECYGLDIYRTHICYEGYLIQKSDEQVKERVSILAKIFKR